VTVLICHPAAYGKTPPFFRRRLIEAHLLRCSIFRSVFRSSLCVMNGDQIACDHSDDRWRIVRGESNLIAEYRMKDSPCAGFIGCRCRILKTARHNACSGSIGRRWPDPHGVSKHSRTPMAIQSMVFMITAFELHRDAEIVGRQ
jgi:hypothetical protein